MIGRATFTALALAIAATAVASAPASAGNNNDKQAYIERMLENEANGGPTIEGGIARGQNRHRICQYLERPAYDEDGYPTTVLKKTCWFE